VPVKPRKDALNRNERGGNPGTVTGGKRNSDNQWGSNVTIAGTGKEVARGTRLKVTGRNEQLKKQPNTAR